MKKTVGVISLFLILTASVFAEPGFGGRGGGFGGGPDRGGYGGWGRDGTENSGSNNSGNTGSTSSSNSGSSSSSSSYSGSSAGQGPGSDAGSDRRMNQSASPEFNKADVNGNGTFNEATGWHTVKEPSDFMNYRGTRKATSTENLSVEQVKAEKSKNGLTTVEVNFNQEVNPRSFSVENIKINGETAGDDVKFKFNRKGDSIKITIPEQLSDFSLSIEDVQSFEGEKTENILMENITVK